MWLWLKKGKACLKMASCCIVLQFDTQTSMVPGHVSSVKWVQIPLRQAEMSIEVRVEKEKRDETILVMLTSNKARNLYFI